MSRYILGAPDHEMTEIRRVLAEHGASIVDATPAGREAARLAYQSAVVPQAGDVWIECAPALGGKAAIRAAGGMVIDHHHPGDPGWGAAPRRSFEASSLGQVLALLQEERVRAEGIRSAEDEAFVHGGEIPANAAQRAIGEADHCLAAFVTGRCSTSRDAARAHYLARLGPVADLIPDAEAALLAAPELVPGVRDLRGIPDLAPGGRLGAALVPAAVLAGVAYLGWGVQGVTPLGRHVGIGGAGEGSAVGVLPQASILASVGAVGIYGDAVRGVGGGYVPE